MKASQARVVNAGLAAATTVVCIVILSVLFQGCGSDGEQVAPAAVGRDSQAATPTAERRDKKADGYACLTTPNGVPRKVIVKRQGAVAFERYEFNGAQYPLKFFNKYFVFEEQQEPNSPEPTGYLIGEASRLDSTLGWVKAEDVIPWNHEQAVYFVNKGSRYAEPVRVWMDRRDVGDEGRTHFEENLDSQETTEPFPVIERRGRLFKLAFLWDKPSHLDSVTMTGVGSKVANPGREVQRGSTRGAAYVEREFQTLKQNLVRMDVALVMDVTSSMTPYMERVRDQLITIIDQLRSLGSNDFPIRVHIGVVAYRDYADAASASMIQVLDLSTDRIAVTQFLRGLRPFSVGVGRNEAVFEGIDAAVNRLSWGDNSYRVLMLVGDAPPHQPGDTDTKLLLAKGGFQSPYFNRSLSSNFARVAGIIDNELINFRAFGVGNNPNMQDVFHRLSAACSNGEFMALANAKAFIEHLAADLRNQAGDHIQEGHKAVEAIRDVKDTGRKLTEHEVLILRNRGISAREIEQLSKQRIQTGWFDLKAVRDRVQVSVYLRRRDLDAMMIELRGNMAEGFAANKLPVLKSILKPYLGKDGLVGVTSSNELMKRAAELPLPPDILRRIFNLIDDRTIRDKMNGLLILMLDDKLFNQYEEGWIPMEYLPGSFGVP